MSVLSADFQTAIFSAWEASGLDATFKSLWGGSVVVADFPVLHETEASPGQPFPYCVVKFDLPNVGGRMYSGGDTKDMIIDVETEFNIFADEVVGDARSSKQIAASLAEEIMKVFGGHPTEGPSAISLTHGFHLITQYQNDYSARAEEDKHQWVVKYLFKLDVPVAV